MGKQVEAFADALRRRVKEIREQRGWTQDDFAWIARAAGLTKWTRGTVHAFEAGRRLVSVEELLGLLIALRASFDELFPNDSSQPNIAILNDSWEFEPGGLAQIVAGTLFDEPARALEIALKEDSERELRRVADEKAAAALGLEPHELNVIARRLWGGGFTRHRDELVEERTAGQDLTPRGLQAVRGHVTRDLIGEVQEHLAKGRRRGSSASPGKGAVRASR
jgi:transcriptional regulator with XRE-family HTH domain